MADGSVEGTYEVHPLSPEDAQRMRRLSEEVRGRLEEIALIATRAAGTTLGPNMTPKFSPRSSAADRFVPGSVVEIVGEGSDQICIIYCTDPIGTMGGTVISERPCGSAGPNPCEHAFPNG